MAGSKWEVMPFSRIRNLKFLKVCRIIALKSIKILFSFILEFFFFKKEEDNMTQDIVKVNNEKKKKERKKERKKEEKKE